MNLRTSFAIVAVLAVAAACGGQATATIGAATPGGTTPTPTLPPQGPTVAPLPTTAPPVGGSGTSVIHVVVATGPHAGTYDATGIKYDCNTSAGGSGATYLDLAATEGVTNLQFTAGEGGANPAKFYFQIAFGQFSLQQPTMEISTLVPGSTRGSGTATLQDNSSTIKWTIDGTTADGIGVTATVECGPVDRS